MGQQKQPTSDCTYNDSPAHPHRRRYDAVFEAIQLNR